MGSTRESFLEALRDFLMDSLWTPKVPLRVHGLNAFPVIVRPSQPLVLGAYVVKVRAVFLVNVTPMCCIPARVFFVNKLLCYAHGNPTIEYEVLSRNPVDLVFEFINPADKVRSALNRKLRSLVCHI